MALLLQFGVDMYHKELVDIVPHANDRQVIESTFDTIEGLIIKPIADSRLKDIESKFEQSLEQFFQTMLPVAEIISKTSAGREKKISSVTGGSMKTLLCGVEKYLGKKNAQMMRLGIENFEETKLMLLDDYLYRQDRLQRAVQETLSNEKYSKEFLHEVSGFGLGVLTLAYLINSRKARKRAVAKMAKITVKYMTKVSEWIETFDIMCDPETVASLKRSDAWLRKHDTDYAKVFPEPL